MKAGTMPLIDMPTVIIGSAFVVCILLVTGFALNGMLNEDGFGPFGNTAIMIFGFFGALKFMPELGFRVYTLQAVVFMGLAGAFALIVFLIVAKAALSRMFPEG